VPITLRCPDPQCGRTLVIPDEYRGQTGTCQFCGAAVQVPATVGGPPIPPPGTYADTRPSSRGRSTWVIVAIVAAVMLVVCIGGCLVMSAITGPVFMKARGKARQTSCLSNMKQLGMGALMYAQDHGNMYPPAPSWLAEIQPYLPSGPPTCPEGAEYVMNPRLSGQPLAAITDPARTILAYEAQGGQPAFVHEGYCNVAFCDGHARAIDEGSKANFIW